jgi:hypothetical protein
MGSLDMARTSTRARELIAYGDEPVCMISDTDEYGTKITRIVVGDSPFDNEEQKGTADLRALAGILSEYDSEDMEDELDKIRHSNPPTPPIDAKTLRLD